MKIDVDVAKSRVALLQTQVDDLTKKVTQDTSSALQPFADAQRNVEQQQSILDALNVRLKQDLADATLAESPVRIISRATTSPPFNSPSYSSSSFPVIAGRAEYKSSTRGTAISS